ncbi:uncharacterized protein LOC100845747 [Brachypodium distachyon]|uniref:Uncharacterized protein n=1 Tax=Brachypodium distachyon TaxID=15368 RepID=I1GY67_BRADI|nr:uncharacterized protein LOC100845747 [Brachypodium distachyon]KQK18078.1 hypothetical protein BRADI_1g38640v3 [Brachypodium distachyon]|eukprot:XP_003560683.1 uncharacterized protein LOC100845747 [Brachypodium distachyon]
MSRDIIRTSAQDHGPAADDSGAGAGLALWDCGSALYDSYELTAFKCQLDAAVLACRSLSMPHLRGGPAPETGRRKSGARRLPALLRRLFSKVLRLRFSASGAHGGASARGDRYRAYDGYYSGTGSPWSGALMSIPEESGGGSSPETPPVDVAGPSALRRAQSERFIGSKTASTMVQFDNVVL